MTERQASAEAKRRWGAGGFAHDSRSEYETHLVVGDLNSSPMTRGVSHYWEGCFENADRRAAERAS